MNIHMIRMASLRDNAPASARARDRTKPAPAMVRDEGSWRIFPLEGAFELAYRDEAGNQSTRRVIVRELKVGPGKTLLGGIDMAHDGYRGFRADRIQRIVDADTGQTIDRNILDWLMKRASGQAKARGKALAKAARAAEGRGTAPGAVAA